MKRLLISLLFISFSVSAHNALLHTTKIAYYGSVIYPTTITKIVPIPLFFKGDFYLIEPEKNSQFPHKAIFEFYEEKTLPELYFLVTTYLSPPKSLEVDQWQTSSTHPYRLFHLSYKPYTNTFIDPQYDTLSSGTAVATPTSTSETLYEWIIEEKDNSKPVIAVPDNTLVLFAEPAWITIRPTLFDIQHPFRTLPSITLLETPNEATFLNKLNEMVCACMDFKQFHKKPLKAICALANGKTVIRLPMHKQPYRVG